MFQRRDNFGRSEVFDSGPRLTQLLFAGFISGLAAAALFFLVSYFALRLRHASNSEPLDLFLKGVCSTSFREGVLGLEGVLVSFAVALAAFTWMERRRPGDPNRVRIWLKQVVTDAKREDICFISAMLLVMLFGASAWAYFLSVASSWWMRYYVGGDIFISLVLFVVSGLLAALLGLMQTSSNGTYLGYARASRKLVLMAGYMFRRADDRGMLSLTARELRSGVNRKLVKFSVLASLSVWFPYVWYRGGRGTALFIPCILAFVILFECYIFLNMMYSLVGDVVLSERRAVNCGYYLSLFCFAVVSSGVSGVFVLAIYRTSVADRGSGSGGDWRIDAIVFILSMWWIIYSVLYFGVGFKLWGLYDIGLLSLWESRDRIVRSYVYFSDAISAISSEARCDILAEVVPADWSLYFYSSNSRLDSLFVGWHAWRRRVGLASPSEIDSEAQSVNLRAFMQDAFKVDVCAANCDNISNSRSFCVDVETIDFWHYRSVLQA